MWGCSGERRAAPAAVAAVVLAAGLAAGVTGCGGGRVGPHLAALPPPAVEQYGANVNYLFTYRGHTPAEIAAQLTELRATGATIARTDSLWEATETAPPRGGRHDYNWGFDDRVEEQLAAAHLRWEPIIDYTPSWAESVPGAEHSAPTSDAAYADYAGAFATRFGPGGAFWQAHPQLPQLPIDTYEIWNEPDNPDFWQPSPNPAQYAALYAAARAAIRRAQPGGRVIVGGLDQVTPFLPLMVSDDPALQGRIDGVAVHPYHATPQQVIGQVMNARRVLDGIGLSHVPLYVTEWGWDTSPPGRPQYAPASQRPGWIALTLAALDHRRCGVAAMVLYTWTTPERHANDPQDWYGINPPGGGGGPDVAGFAAGLRAAAAPGAPGPC